MLLRPHLRSFFTASLLTLTISFPAVWAEQDKVPSGNTHLRKGEFDLAQADFAAALKAKPTDVAALRGMAEAYQGKRQYENAVQFYSKAIEQAPQDFGSFTGRATANFYLERLVAAREDYKAALALHPTDAYMMGCVGNCYRHLKDSANAERYYDMAIKAQPKFVDPYLASAWDFDVQNKKDKALERYNQALVLNPQNFEGLSNRGRLFEKLGENDKGPGRL